MSPTGVVQVPDVQVPATIANGLLRALGACVRHTGRPWGPALLAGICGHGFESTWGIGGVEVWSYGDLEWYHHGRGLARLGLDVDGVELIANNPSVRPIPSAAERRAALAAAFDAVAASVARGVPALVVNPKTPAQRDAGIGWMNWGPVSGVDHDRLEYLVPDPSGSGSYRVPRDELGRADPVQWLSVVTFRDPATPTDDAEIARSAIADAVALLSGERAGSSMPAAENELRHGTEGLAVWADEVAAAGDADGALRGAAARWASAREAAATFCDWAAGVVPDQSRATIEAGRDALRAQASAFARIAGAAGDDPALAREAASLQRAALEALRRAVA